MRGLLGKATYGARDAAQNWELEHADVMTEAGGVPHVRSTVRKRTRGWLFTEVMSQPSGLAKVWTGPVELHNLLGGEVREQVGERQTRSSSDSEQDVSR